MRDRDIRAALRKKLQLAHQGEDGTLFLDELGLCQGIARIDFAVINGSINGYEIKSDFDTLDRLPGQQAVYNKALDTVTIVACGGHLQKILQAVPKWWGVVEAVGESGSVGLVTIREPRPNPHVDPYAVAQLLWRDEVLGLLKEMRLDQGMQSKPRRALWKKLAESRPAEELSALVRKQLKARSNWRSVSSPASCGD